MSYRGLLKQARSAVVIACGVALMGGVLPVFAQTTTSGDGGAGGFAGSNPPPPLGDPGQVVPGAGGDTTGWSGYSSDPNRLISAGEANAPGNEYLQVIGGGSVNAARYDLSNNDDWLKRSLDLLGDPGNEVGDLTGDANTSCQQETTQVTHEEKSLYTCETATPVTNQPQSCTRIYKPEFDTDYVYQCQAGNQWRSETRTCEPERVVTVDEDYVYSCKTGTVWTHTPASCQRRRIVVVDEDYQYGCVQTWNGSTHAPNAACTANGQPGCVASGGRVCAAPSGLPSSYVCQQGYAGTSVDKFCDVNQVVEIFPTGTFDGESWRAVTTAADVAAYSGCTISNYRKEGTIWKFSANCPNGLNISDMNKILGDSFGRTGWSSRSTNPHWLKFYVKTAGPGRDQGVKTNNTCAPLEADTTCRMTGDVCTEPAGSRMIDGTSVYRECWKYARRYTCGSRTDYAGCAAPAGMALTGERCLATDAGGTARIGTRIGDAIAFSASQTPN